MMALMVGLMAGGAQEAVGQEVPTPPGTKKTLRELDRLDQEKVEIRQRLFRVQETEQEMRTEIDRLTAAVRRIRYRKQNLEFRIQNQIAARNRQSRVVKNLEKHIAESKRRIGLRLRRVYHLIKKNQTMTLFQIARSQALLKDSYYLSRMQDTDREAILKYETLARAVTIKREEMRDHLRVLIQLRQDHEQETERLTEREAFLRKTLTDTKKDRSLYGAYLKDVEKTMTGMQSAIVKMEKLAREKPKKDLPKTPGQLKGRLPVPVKGKLIARFGAQDPRFAVKKFQRGVILGVVENAPVTAVASGRVIHAGYVRGYQSLVVLDHGGELLTVYGHLEGLNLHRDDTVVQGQLLGLATYQPVSRDFNVYFEVRYKGKPQNPLRWVRRGPWNSQTRKASGLSARDRKKRR